MREAPDTADLVALAREALSESVLPELSGAPRYQAQMALNALSVAARQIEAGRTRRDEAARLLVELCDGASLDACRRNLAARIRSGEMRPGTYAALLAVTRSAVEESNPKARALTQLAQTDPADS